jgi:hypothetical protein
LGIALESIHAQPNKTGNKRREVKEEGNYFKELVLVPHPFPSPLFSLRSVSSVITTDVPLYCIYFLYIAAIDLAE